MANPTWYFWMVLSWTVRTLTMRLKEDIVPTKSSSAWVPQASGLTDGRFSRCCTSNGCRISPKKWSLGWNFHRVIPHGKCSLSAIPVGIGTSMPRIQQKISLRRLEKQRCLIHTTKKGVCSSHCWKHCFEVLLWLRIYVWYLHLNTFLQKP